MDAVKAYKAGAVGGTAAIELAAGWPALDGGGGSGPANLTIGLSDILADDGCGLGCLI